MHKLFTFLCFMLMFSSVGNAKLDFVVVQQNNIYKYHIATEKITQIGDDQVEGYSIDWVSGSALPVSPKSKMQTQWGEIKKTSHGK